MFLISILCLFDIWAALSGLHTVGAHVYSGLPVLYPRACGGGWCCMYCTGAWPIRTRHTTAQWGGGGTGGQNNCDGGGGAKNMELHILRYFSKDEFIISIFLICLHYYKFIFRKVTKEVLVPPFGTSFQNYRFHCAFSTCGVVFETVSKLKTHLLNHHKTAHKDCIYSRCGYSTSNSFTLKVYW